MNSTRNVFLLIVMLALLALGGAAYYRYGAKGTGAVTLDASTAKAEPTQALARAKAPAPTDAPARSVEPAAAAPVTATPAPTDASPVLAAVAAVTATAAPAPAAAMKPVYGKGVQLSDGLPAYVCGSDGFGSYFALQQIQMSGLDVQRGYHLGIVPFGLNPGYNATEKQRKDMLERGDIDCYFATLNTVALNDPGVVTAIIDESAGADQVWARDVAKLNDLKGKRITFEANGAGEFFAYYLLKTVSLDPKTDVQLVPQPHLSDAIELFNAKKADVVIGWEPNILAAEEGGGKLLVSTKQFRPIVDVIVTSRKALVDRKDIVALFHESWFTAIKAQAESFDAAASAIASWGNNDFTAVRPDSASDDLKLWLGTIAQADIADNARAMSDPADMAARVQDARDLWRGAGIPVPDTDVAQSIDPEFVLNFAAKINANLKRPNALINNTFSIGSSQIDPALREAAAAPRQDAVGQAQDVMTLPCTHFEFVPNSSDLLEESQQLLESCALKVMQQSQGLLMRVQGSSAWPGPKGTFTEAQVQQKAQERAQSIVDFLVSKGIDKNRFVVESKLPPVEHRETLDIAQQSQDRYVELSLLTSGL